jgi:sulfate adenylyltransferase (ADP) / ATP adenylyltransferase
MYCVHRPLLVLHTNKYKPQTGALDLSDFAAVLAIMNTMKTEQMVLYNCGVEAGSSQGHKHLQLLPAPGIELFPDTDRIPGDRLNIDPWSVSGVPFKHWAMRFPPHSTASHLLVRYQRLLEKTTEVLGDVSAKIAYNVVIKRPWILLIPRTHARSRDGRAATNGAGLLGLVWVADQAERDDWTRVGMSDHLAYLGTPA